MFPTINPTTTTAWDKLRHHYDEIKSVTMKSLFEKDPARFDKMSIGFKDGHLEYFQL